MKRQTTAQRVANPVWLRDQIGQLVQDCDENIADDAEQARCAGSIVQRDKYLARVESHRHWKHQLERVLRGRTFAEELAAELREVAQ